jgi:putative ABC transport system permease protein
MVDAAAGGHYFRGWRPEPRGVACEELMNWLVLAQSKPEEASGLWQFVKTNFWLVPWTLLGLELMLALGLVFFSRVPLTYNVENLKVRWRTTLMTALAFTLVVALLTVMLAFVNGMYELTKKSGQPGNVIVMAEGATDETFSSLSPEGLGDIETQSGILRDNGEPLSSRESFMLAKQPIVSAKPGSPNGRFLQIRGIEDPVKSARVHALDLVPGGRWFSEAGVQEAKDGGAPFIEAVIGSGIAMEMGKDKTNDGQPAAPLRVGDTFSLSDRTWVIVGVIKAPGTTFDSEVWAKRSLVGPLMGKNDCSSLVLRTAGQAEAEKLADFLSNKEGKGYGKLKLSSLTELKYFSNLTGTATTFTVAAWFVTAILATGGIFGVLNTMFAAVSQRIRDIGVLRLLGFPRRQILISFLLESILIAALGGLLGCAIGSLCHGWSATSTGGGQGGGGKTFVLELLVTPGTLATGMSLSLAMGILGGLLPSLNAMRLKVLDTLR